MEEGNSPDYYKNIVERLILWVIVYGIEEIKIGFGMLTCFNTVSVSKKKKNENSLYGKYAYTYNKRIENVSGGHCPYTYSL